MKFMACSSIARYRMLILTVFCIGFLEVVADNRYHDLVFLVEESSITPSESVNMITERNEAGDVTGYLFAPKDPELTEFKFTVKIPPDGLLQGAASGSAEGIVAVAGHFSSSADFSFKNVTWPEDLPPNWILDSSEGGEHEALITVTLNSEDENAEPSAELELDGEGSIQTLDWSSHQRSKAEEEEQSAWEKFSHPDGVGRVQALDNPPVVSFSVLSLELDVRETSRPNNRIGPDDPRLVPPDDDNARDKLLVWGGSSSTISFDAVRPPGITGPIWIQIEDSGGAAQQFEKLELADKTYAESYAVNTLDPDLTLKYGIDQDNSSTLTGDEVKGSYEIYGVSENERVASVNTLNATLATALYDLADALVRKFVEGSFSAPGPFQTDFRPDNHASPGSITLSPNPAAEVVHNFGGTFTQLPFVTMNGRQYHEASITMPLFTWGASNPANDLLRGHGDFEEAIENYANSLSYSAVAAAWNAGTTTANPDIRICSFSIPPTVEVDFPPAGTVGLGDCDVASGALVIHVEKVGSSYYVYSNDTDHASVSSVILEDKWDYNYFKDVDGAAGFESQAAAQVQCSHGQSGVPSGSGEVFFVRIEVDGELDEAISIVVRP